MSLNPSWSRRTFLQGIGCTSTLGLLNRLILGSKVAEKHTNATAPVEFAYVISGNDSEAVSEIHVFEVHGDDWIWRQSVPSRAPISLALHPIKPVLYVANDVDEYDMLPRGTVEAYKIDSHDGRLALIARQPLSLSGIRPRHLAVSPCGNHLVVAVHGGGAYNVLPIDRDGAIGRVSGILKEVGAGAHPVHQQSAHPHSVAFHPAGDNLVAADEGCDRITVFAFGDGRLTRIMQMRCRRASGPGHLVIHPSTNFLYISNVLDGSLDSYSLHTDAAVIRHEQHVDSPGKLSRAAGQLVLSSSGRTLYAALADEGIAIWRVEPITGKLVFTQLWKEENRSPRFLIESSDNRRMFVSDSYRQELLSIAVDAESGGLGASLAVAKLTAPGRLIVRSSAAV